MHMFSRLLYWRRDASLITLDYCIGGMHLSLLYSHYISLLYWRDASLATLVYCIGGMHLSLH